MVTDAKIADLHLNYNPKIFKIVQLGTDPFCIILEKRYKRGLSPIVSFLSEVSGGGFGAALSVYGR